MDIWPGRTHISLAILILFVTLSVSFKPFELDKQDEYSLEKRGTYLLNQGNQGFLQKPNILVGLVCLVRSSGYYNYLA